MSNIYEQRNRERKAARLVAALDDLIDRVPDVIDTIDAEAVIDVVAEWTDDSWAKLVRRVDPKGKATVGAETRALVIGAYRKRARGYGQRQALPDLAERIARAFEPPPPFKACGCGKEFSHKQWRELERIGRMEGEGGMDLELRNCPCGSTISVEVPRVTVCSICGWSDCRNVNCAAEAGIKGLPREVRAA